MNTTKSPSTLLRQEQPADYRETENLVREAFWNRYAPGCCEHYLVNLLRTSPALVPELNLVAVREGNIVGHIASTKAVLHGDDGHLYEDVLTLGPIAVLPAYQGQGIGGQLIAHTKALAKDLGYRAIVLYGDPDYYVRHGFLPAEQFRLRTADGMYAVAHQVCPLSESAPDTLAGRHVEASIFDMDEAAIAAFDATFPEKERLFDTPSQKRFQTLAALRKEAR